MDKHIVYTSVEDARTDEFWYSEGWLTATKAGDGILFAIIATPLLVWFLGWIIHAYLIPRYG